MWLRSTTRRAAPQTRARGRCRRAARANANANAARNHHMHPGPSSGPRAARAWQRAPCGAASQARSRARDAARPGTGGRAAQYTSDVASRSESAPLAVARHAHLTQRRSNASCTRGARNATVHSANRPCGGEHHHRRRGRSVGGSNEWDSPDNARCTRACNSPAAVLLRAGGVGKAVRSSCTSVSSICSFPRALVCQPRLPNAGSDAACL
jgi:hypothetical protein